ncbi:MAG: hypothetical protein D6761_12025, partial [Candidatus Dadabacteria bacterium]
MSFLSEQHLDPTLRAALDRFLAEQIRPHFADPLHPPDLETTGKLIEATSALGLIPTPDWPGQGLWHDLPVNETLLILARVAAISPALAWALHLQSAGSKASQMLTGQPGAATQICTTGWHWPITEALLTGHEPRLPGGRRLWLAPATESIWFPVSVDAQQMRWTGIEPSRQPAVTIPAPHGNELLPYLEFAIVEAHAADAPTTSREDWIGLLARDLLGVIAVATGAAAGALHLAKEYATQRQQGGVVIAVHDAVRELIGRSQIAIDGAATALAALGSAPSAGDALACYAQWIDRLFAAADNAIQIFGGMGYMRDTGVEAYVRAIGALRAWSGPSALFARVLAADAAETTSAEPAEIAAERTKPLHPARSWQRLAATARPLVAYDPVSLWEEDTRRLPEPLAAWRRRYAQFARVHVAPLALEADLMSHDAEPPAAILDLLSRAAREGLLSALLPKPLGSLHWSLMRYPLVWLQTIRTEELCAAGGGLGLLLSAHYLGAVPILLSGDPISIRRWLLPAFRDHRRGIPHLFAYAITEPSGGSDVEDTEGAALYRPGTVARRKGKQWVLSGRKIFISGGDLAQTVTVFAALEGEGLESWTCFVVRKDDPGFRVVRNEIKLGQRACAATELEFDEIHLDDSRIVGKLRQGW